MAIDNLSSLLANKEIYPLIERPDELRYYLSPDEYNLILQTLQQLIDDYNDRIDGIDGVTLQNVIKSTDTTTIPSDYNVYTALRTLQEIQAIISQSNAEYLSKKNDDSAAGKITFQKGLEIGNYQPGFQGGNIAQSGEAELKALKLRDWLEVPELRYNRVEVLLGDKWRAPGGGIIKSVDTTARTITLKLEDGEIGAVSVNDLCFGIIHSMDNSENSTSDLDDGKGTRYIKGFASIYFKVEEILDTSGNNQTFRYSLRPISSNYTRQIHPKEFMHFVAFGNTSNPDRQNSAYETRTYERFLTGINNWEYTQLNIAAQFGDLSNLTVFGLNMTGYSIYLNNVYFTGNIQQIKAPMIINGYWYTWNGTEWVNTGVGATMPGTSPIELHLTNNNVSVYDDDVIDLSNTITEIHVYEGENELTYKPTGELENGQYRVIASGTNITPGELILVNIFVSVDPASNITDNSARILFTVTGKRLNGSDFSIARAQNITKVERGRDGTSVEYVFAATETPNPPIPLIQSINARQEDDWVPTGWDDNGGGVSDELPYEWRAKRTKKDGVWSRFDPAVIVNKWGEDGNDGDAYEYIFKRTPTYIAPSPYPSDLAAIQDDDFVPDASNSGPGYEGWSDNPVGPTRDLEYEWTCKRVKKDGVWGKYTFPALWAKYSKDGGSTETIYRRTSVFTPPSPPVEWADPVQIDAYIPTNWTRSPQGVNSDSRYEWMSIRNKVNEEWTGFSEAAIHNIYAEDGKDIEFIFNLTKTTTPPNIVINQSRFQEDDYVPTDGGSGSGWTDNAQDVTIEWPYLWISKREKVDEVWQSFSNPTLLSKYGEDGADYEYIYFLTATQTAPQIIYPSGENTQVDDYKPVNQNNERWSDNWLNVTPELPFQWISKRQKKEKVWGLFDVPILYNKWASDGQPGPDGAALEYWGQYDNRKEYYGYSYKIVAVKVGTGPSAAYYKTKRNAGTIPANTNNPLEIPQSPLPTGSKWENFGGNFESIATSMLLAEGANIANFLFREGKLVSQAGKLSGVAMDHEPSNNPNPNAWVPNIMLDGTTGSGHLAGTNFSWDDTGHINASNITLTGRIESLTGYIGKWTIDENGLYASVMSSGGTNGGSLRIESNPSNPSSSTDYLRINNNPQLITSGGSSWGRPKLTIGGSGVGIAINNTGVGIHIESQNNAWSIRSQGSHNFNQPQGATWWSPGVLLALEYNMKSFNFSQRWNVTNGVSWHLPSVWEGGSISLEQSYNNGNGTLRIGHTIGHTDYMVFATSQAKDGWIKVNTRENNYCILEFGNHKAKENIHIMFVGRTPTGLGF